MFSSLAPPSLDPIIRLMRAYAQDPRPDKIDLGVGVYRDSEGKTPIMAAVKAAESELIKEQTSKEYTVLNGNAGFLAGIQDLLLGSAFADAPIASMQTAAGSGALRTLFELCKALVPDARLWLSLPTWAAHRSFANFIGLRRKSYRYFDPATCEVDFQGVIEDIGKVQAGDIVLLHGCCHNPTGADFTPAQWQELAESLAERGAVPLVDIAYQGFGQGLAADAWGVRHLAQTVDEMMVAFSCSKNFGLYRDRVGAAFVLCKSHKDADVMTQQLMYYNRMSQGFPPDHGAAVVQTILQTPSLRNQWEYELNDMRSQMVSVREQLAGALRQATNSGHFDFIVRHQGMFSRLGLNQDQVTALREQGIYMVPDSRINVAGLIMPGRIDLFAKALASVL